MEKSKKNIVLIGFFFVALSWISVKFSAPVLTFLNKEFDTSEIYLKIAGTLYLFVFACVQLFWGSISKFFSRKKVLYSALFLGILGTVITMLSRDVGTFIMGRMIEAMGMGAASCMCRVLLADRLTKNEIASATIFFGLIYSLNPIISPTIGQYIIILFGWRYIFATFAALLILYTFLVIFRLQESNPHPQESFSLKSIKKDLLLAFKSRVFWAYILGITIFTGIMIGYYMAIPFWFLVHFQISEKYYTLLSVFTAIPNILAYYFTRFWIKKHGATKCLRVAYLLALLAPIIALFEALFWGPNVFSILIPLFIIAICAGITQPCTNVGIITEFRKNPGIVSAFIPVFGVGSGGIFFFIFSNMPLDTLWPFFTVLGIIALLGLWTRSQLKKHASHL